MDNLIDRDKFNTLSDIEINQQIELRKNLIQQMVGWLYPSILQGEIYSLKELLDIRL